MEARRRSPAAMPVTFPGQLSSIGPPPCPTGVLCPITEFIRQNNPRKSRGIDVILIGKWHLFFRAIWHRGPQVRRHQCFECHNLLKDQCQNLMKITRQPIRLIDNDHRG
jgi:hypothetical protein